MKLEGRHALITGGSSGIGRATALLLAGCGVRISILARDPTKLAQTKKAIEALHPGLPVSTVSASVEDRVQVERGIADITREAGPLDLVITSAGIAHAGTFLETPIEVYERTMAVNYFGSLYVVRAVLPEMLERKQGRIVLISSGAGLVGIFGYAPYSPTKFALRGLAESLRAELRGTGVGISIAYPPDTDTPQLQHENATKPPETRKITATAGTWSAEAVAAVIVRGIENDAFIIAPGWQMRLLATWHSVLAPGLNWYFDRLARR